ncbi:MAG: DUF2784 family protein [Nanoarchaeota archaeon]
MKKSDYESLAEKISIIHIFIFVVTISAMVLIFFYKPLIIYSAFWLALIWLIELVYGFSCPLTTEEYDLRIKAGEHIKRKKFIPTFLHRYLGINIPDWLAEIWLAMYFLISMFVLINHFFY